MNHPAAIPLGIPWIGLVSCLLVGLSGCNRESIEAKSAPAVPVRVAKVEMKRLRPSFVVIGNVVAAPERMALLAAPASGLVKELKVSEGAAVEPGQLIIQLDEQKASHDLEKARAAYNRLLATPWDEEVKLAQSAVDKALAAKSLATAKFKSAQDLRAKNKELLPDLQLQEEERNAKVAGAELDAAESQLRSLKPEIRAAQEQELLAECHNAELLLKWCRLSSPLAGEVLEIKARMGQRVEPGAPLATVVDLGEVLVQVRIPLGRLDGLMRATSAQNGDAAAGATTAQVRTEAFPGQLFAATIDHLGQQTEAQTGDVSLWLRVKNPHKQLRLGMPVKVEIFTAEVDALAIPEAALAVNEEGQRVVTVIRDGKAYPTEVELGAEGGAEIRAQGCASVLKGLRTGDVVAIENGYALPEGCPVTVLPPVVASETARTP